MYLNVVVCFKTRSQDIITLNENMLHIRRNRQTSDLGLGMFFLFDGGFGEYKYNQMRVS